MEICEKNSITLWILGWGLQGPLILFFTDSSMYGSSNYCCDDDGGQDCPTL